jgi:4-amino-4-deoxy-L-arabinose transferase-like glycosyltransferase
MALFGDSAWAIQFLLLLWTLPTIYFLYRLAYELTDDEATAVLAALFYAILSAHLQLWGQTAETELFANLFRITAVWLLVVLLKRQKPAWQFVGVGLLAATAFLYKPVYLSSLALAGLALLITWFRQRGQIGSWRWFWPRGGWLVVGFVSGLLPVVLYFAGEGLWNRLLLVFTLGQSYGADNALNPEVASGAVRWLLYPLLPLFGLGLNNAALLIFSLAAALLILRNKALRRSPLLWLLLWYLLSFVEAGINLELFAHYYLLIVPPLAILAAWFMRKLYRDLLAANKKVWATAVFSILLVISLGISAWENGQYWQQYLRYKTGNISLEEFVELGWPSFGPRLTRVASLAEFVAAQTEPDDSVYYWSEDVQLYYLANRRPPIDMIWPIDIAASGPPQRVFTPQTQLIIIDRREPAPAPPDWFMAELAANYLLEAEFDEQVVYRRAE